VIVCVRARRKKKIWFMHCLTIYKATVIYLTMWCLKTNKHTIFFPFPEK